MKKIFIAAAAVLLANMANAENCSMLSAEHQKCIDKAMATTDIIECNSAESARQDKVLNQVYKEVMKCLTKEKAEELKKGQRAWLKLRDGNSGFMSDLTGGTIDGINSSSQYAEDIAIRVQYLQAIRDTVCEPAD